MYNIMRNLRSIELEIGKLGMELIDKEHLLAPQDFQRIKKKLNHLHKGLNFLRDCMPPDEEV